MFRRKMRVPQLYRNEVRTRFVLNFLRSFDIDEEDEYTIHTAARNAEIAYLDALDAIQVIPRYPIKRWSYNTAKFVTRPLYPVFWIGRWWMIDDNIPVKEGAWFKPMIFAPIPIFIGIGVGVCFIPFMIVSLLSRPFMSEWLINKI